MALNTPLQPDLNMLLTGYREPNKPRLGRAVAEALGMKFVDVEEEIELRLGDSPARIREQYGERRLKALQDDVIEGFLLRRATVIRVGGNTLMNTERRDELLATGKVICLVARLDAILRLLHLSLGTRFHDPDQRALEVGDLRREWAVRKLEGIHEIDATYKDEARLVQEVCAWWRQVAVARG
jgi:shikimate kinase